MILAERWRPSEGMTVAILLMSPLIRFVTVERARSASDETIPTSKPNSSGQFLGYGIHLAAGPSSSVEIVEPLCLLGIFPQLVNAPLVFCLGL